MHAVLPLTKIHSSRCAELARRVLRPRLLLSHKRFLKDGRFPFPLTSSRHWHGLCTYVHVSKFPYRVSGFLYLLKQIYGPSSGGFSCAYICMLPYFSTYGPHHVGPSSPRTGNLYLCLSVLVSFWSMVRPFLSPLARPFFFFMAPHFA